MPNIYERALSRPFSITTDSGSISREFVVTGTQLQDEVVELTLTVATLTFAGLVRSAIKADPQGGGIWFVTVEYANIDPQQAVGQDPQAPEGPGGDVAGGMAPLSPAISWTTASGEKVHITQSKGTISKTDTAGITTPGNAGNDFTLDNKRAIGLTRDGIQGVDIDASVFEWSIDVPRAFCTHAYAITVKNLKGKTNNAPFYGFATGEVRYLGATANYSQEKRWNINHKFAVAENEVNIIIGNGITVPAKGGWEYLWVAYEPKQVGNLLLSLPVAAYVERVFDPGNFRLLEIGA